MKLAQTALSLTSPEIIGCVKFVMSEARVIYAPPAFIHSAGIESKMDCGPKGSAVHHSFIRRHLIAGG